MKRLNFNWKDYFIYFTLGFLSYFFINLIMPCEVKALSAGPSGYNNMYTNKGTRYSLSAGLETIDGVTYYLGHTKRGDITTLQFAIDNLSGTSNDYNVSFNIIVHGLLVKNPSVTINEYNSLNFGQSCTIVSENTSHSETDYTLYNANVTCSAISLSKNYMVTIGGFENITYGGISPSITYSQSTGNYDQKLDDVNDSINNVGDKVGDVNDTLNDGSVDSDQIGSIGSNLPPTTGPLSAIINLPIRFFQVLLNALDSKTCPVISFTIPWVNYPCTIPCVRNLLEQIGALEFYETIGSMVGAVLLFKYAIYMGKTFQKMSDLEDTSSSTWGGL